MPPPDLLTDLTADAPEAATRPAAPAKQTKAPQPEAAPDIAAELQRIVTQLDALVKQCGEPSAGVKRSGDAEADALAMIGELRGVVDAAAQGTNEAREALSERLAAIEAAVGALPAVPGNAGEIVEHLKLARSSLVGLSKRVEGLERRPLEALEAIERAASAVRETAAGLAATGKTLGATAQANAQVLLKVTHLADEVVKLRRAAYWGWAVVSCLVVIVIMIVAEYTIGLVGKWLMNLKAMVLG